LLQKGTDATGETSETPGIERAPATNRFPRRFISAGDSLVPRRFIDTIDTGPTS